MISRLIGMGLIVSGFFLAGAAAQDKKDEGDKKPEPEVVVPYLDGKGMTPRGGGFSVDMPGTAIEKKQPITVGGVRMEVVFYLVQLSAGQNYLVSYCDQPMELMQGKSPDARLDKARDDLVANAKGKLLSEKKIKLAADPGRDVVVELPDDRGLVRNRLYLVKNRLYQVMVTGPKEVVTGAAAEKYLDSFKLTGS